MAPQKTGERPEDVLAGASSLVVDSRAAKSGSVFVALRGEKTDGHHFIADAITRGANVIVMERPVALPEGVRGVVVPDSARMLSRLANIFYGEPASQLMMLGVTGTNGKTTTTQMIAAILNAVSMPAAVIGTLGASFDKETWPLENTTPLAHDLHALLSQLLERGAQAVAMEVSSHALALRRVADIRFRAAALTNISRDHLDFHGTFEAYSQAKRSLFEIADAAVFNIDDTHGKKWAAEIDGPKLTYSMVSDADIVAGEIVLSESGSVFTVDGVRLNLPIPGRFNIANALAAIGIARTLGIDLHKAAAGLATLAPVRGRMEHLSGGGVNVIVDYAHTPDALENALRTVRETTKGKVIVVFGAGGDRDRGKRPQMGKVAAQLADRIVITSDNPRGEEPGEIAADIVAGIGNKPYDLILERREAIETAIHNAAPGDVVIIAGKGHEPYQLIGKEVRAFDDRSVAQAALQARA
ncbi:MAG: UDP-N-acetylmuramoyl-L-alanyl-D-glutamate--2,6-diaminopimelate ligase [Candidatus Baltobacteraceae bacterium]